jgi:hypothetical protein
MKAPRPHPQPPPLPRQCTCSAKPAFGFAIASGCPSGTAIAGAAVASTAIVSQADAALTRIEFMSSSPWEQAWRRGPDERSEIGVRTRPLSRVASAHAG